MPLGQVFAPPRVRSVGAVGHLLQLHEGIGALRGIGIEAILEGAAHRSWGRPDGPGHLQGEVGSHGPLDDNVAVVDGGWQGRECFMRL